MTSESKFAIFAALVDGYQKVESAGLPGFYLLLLLIVGGLNTAVSLFYYLRVVKVMSFEPEPKDRPPFSFPLVSFPGAYVVAITLPVLLLTIVIQKEIVVGLTHGGVKGS